MADPSTDETVHYVQPPSPPPPPASGRGSTASAARSAPPAWVGDFAIQDELGRGAMGVVYGAACSRISTPIALKLIDEKAGDHERERFKIEARAAARLRHPHIVRVLEYHQTPEGRLYLAMERVEGESLGARLKRDGPLPPDEALEIGIALAEALAYAHENSVVHRDLKPANVLIAPDGTPKLTDFGLAKVLDGPQQSLTRTGDLVGTPVYMAPEQARGDRRAVGTHTDVYGLGATLYHLVTGQPPFTGQGIGDVVLKVVTQPPLPVSKLRPGVSAAFDAVLLRCLAKNPKERYADGSELAAALRACRGAQRPAAITWSSPVLDPPTAPPSRTWLKVAGVVGLLAINALFLWDLSRRPAPPPGAPPSQASPPPSPAKSPPGDPGGPLPPSPQAPAWLAWRAQQRTGQGLLYAPGWAEALAEAQVRSVPILVVAVDSTMSYFPTDLLEKTEVLREVVVAVAACEQRHAPESSACPMFGNIRCGTHIETMAALRRTDLQLPRAEAQFPPRALYTDPFGKQQSKVFGRQELAGPRQAEQVQLMIQPPRVEPDELYGFASLGGELPLPDLESLELAAAQARRARQLGGELATLGRARLGELCARGLSFARGAEGEARAKVLARLARLFETDPETKTAFAAGVAALR
ncbi:MAG: serine/threonine-protein kinase [Planctomycetota bacterium]